MDGSDLVVSTLGMALEFGCLTAFDSRVAGPGRKERVLAKLCVDGCALSSGVAKFVGLPPTKVEYTFILVGDSRLMSICRQVGG